MTRASTREREAYSRLAEDCRPKRSIMRNVFRAFFVGGAICAFAQGILNFLLSRRVTPPTAFAATSTAMVFCGSFLTGLGVYDKLGRFAGMGAAIPITGFANSIVSPAMEYKREGFILGVSARMFQVAGPVIVYASIVSLIVATVKIVLR